MLLAQSLASAGTRPDTLPKVQPPKLEEDGPRQVHGRRRQLRDVRFRPPASQLNGRLDEVCGQLGLFIRPRPEPGERIVGFRPDNLDGELKRVEPYRPRVKIELVQVRADQRFQLVLFFEREEGVSFKICLEIF